MTTDKIIKGLATVIIIAAVFAVLGTLWHVVAYIVAAAVLAILGRPFVRIITRIRLFGHNVPRGIAAAITLVIIWIIAGVLLSLFIPLVYNKLYELSTLDWQQATRAVQQAIANAELYIESRLPISVPSLDVLFRDRVVGILDADILANVAPSSPSRSSRSSSCVRMVCSIRAWRCSSLKIAMRTSFVLWTLAPSC